MSYKTRDILERLLWTAIAATLANLGTGAFFNIDAWKSAAMAGCSALVTAVLAIARWRLAVLPNPGGAPDVSP